MMVKLDWTFVKVETFLKEYHSKFGRKINERVKNSHLVYTIPRPLPMERNWIILVLFCLFICLNLLNLGLQTLYAIYTIQMICFYTSRIIFYLNNLHALFGCITKELPGRHSHYLKHHFFFFPIHLLFT